MDGKHVASSVWNGVVGWVRQESAATAALIQAFIALGIAFAWWHWTTAQTGAVIGIVAALLGMFVRSQVTPLVRPRSGRNVPLAEVGPRAAARQAAPTAGPTGGPAPVPQAAPTMPQAAPAMPQAPPPAGPPGEPPAGPDGEPPATPPAR
jgi:hypothetical protein